MLVVKLTQKQIIKMHSKMSLQHLEKKVHLFWVCKYIFMQGFPNYYLKELLKYSEGSTPIYEVPWFTQPCFISLSSNLRCIEDVLIIQRLWNKWYSTWEWQLADTQLYYGLVNKVTNFVLLIYYFFVYLVLNKFFLILNILPSL